MKIKLIHVVVGLGLLGAIGAAYWLQRADLARTGGAPGPVAAMGATSGAVSGGAPGARGGPAVGGPVAVELASVERMRLLDAVQAVGALRAKQSVLLRPEASGRVVSLGFRDGQTVRRGQVLVQLDDSVQRAQWLQAQAQASIARTNVQRQRELAAQNYVSQSAVDQSAAALEVAQSQVALAQAQVQRMRLLAPFDAVAGIRLVNVGDYVKDGADLVALEDRSAMMVDFRLPESALSQLRPGLMVQVKVDALPGREFKARVEAIDAQLEANGRSVLVRARLTEPAGALRSGMFARVELVFAVREEALVVPEEALVPLGAKQWVIKAVPGPKGELLSQRVPVRVGLRVPGRAELIDGVSAGDRIVTAGQARLLRADQQVLRAVTVGASAPNSQAPSAAAPRASMASEAAR